MIVQQDGEDSQDNSMSQTMLDFVHTYGIAVNKT